ncbi:MAG TPA: hypothetical protein VGW38_29220 [Chloroflexota bacterium]|nr:hypothetical protein [Chloroflexota bacterium]
MLDAVAEDVLGTQFMRGVAALQETQYDIAIERLLTVLCADPECAPAHAYLGLAYYLLDDVERATWHLARAIQLDPAAFIAWAEAGNLRI